MTGGIRLDIIAAKYKEQGLTVDQLVDLPRVLALPAHMTTNLANSGIIRKTGVHRRQDEHRSRVNIWGPGPYYGRFLKFLGDI